MFAFVEIKEKENRRKSSHEYSDNNGADSFFSSIRLVSDD